MATEPPDVMGRRRAILTDSERELLAAEDLDDENRRYQAVSRVRNKIDGELPRDVDILEENHEQLLRELRDVVCDGADMDVDSDAAREAFHDLTDAHERLDQEAIDGAFNELADALGVDDDAT